MDNNQDYKKTQEKKSHKGLMVTLILIIFIIAITICIYFLIQKYNAKGQVERFEKAVQENEYTLVSKTLSNNNKTISKSEAKNFVKYIKKDSNYPKFKKEVNNIKAHIDNEEDNSVSLGSITDSKNKKIITIKKDGKKFLFLDKVSFEPHLYKVYVKEFDNTAIYEYKLDKKLETLADKNKMSKIGTFFVGNYTIDAEKTIKNTELNGKVNGQLVINTDNKNSKGQVIAEDVFNQIWFKSKLVSSDELDQDSFKLYINGKETDYKENKVYGKYPYKNQPISVYAVGKIDNKEFKTKTLKVNKNHNQKLQNIKLDFDEAKVHRYKYDTDDKKNKSKEFMKDYMENLNKAYKKGDYDYIKNDIEKGSKLESRIKNATKDKKNIEYKIKSFDKIEREDSQMYITITKTNSNYSTKSKYTLKFDDKNQFKITDYKD